MTREDMQGECSGLPYDEVWWLTSSSSSSSSSPSSAFNDENISLNFSKMFDAISARNIQPENIQSQTSMIFHCTGNIRHRFYASLISHWYSSISDRVRPMTVHQNGGAHIAAQLKLSLFVLQLCSCSFSCTYYLSNERKTPFKALLYNIRKRLNKQIVFW